MIIINKYILDKKDISNIYLLLLYNRSIQDIEHSLCYIALGSTQTHKMI